MSKFRKFGQLAATSLCVLAVAACTKADKDEKAAEILQYVPADTPYVFAAIEPAPKELTDKLEPQVEAMMKAYRQVVDATVQSKIAELPPDSEKREGMENLGAVINELLSIFTPDGMKAAGIDRESKVALYGNGLLPVMRISLTDPALFDEAIARVEQKAEKAMSVGEIDGESYRYVDIEDVRIVLGTLSGYAVATVLPATFDDAQLGRLLGLEKPAESIAATGRLAAMVEEFGFTNHAVGLIDVERLASVFLDTPAGLDADLLAMAGYDSAELGDVCREEIRSLAGIVPRVVAGYTTVEADRTDSTMIIELRDDIATGLAALPASVPGLGVDKGGLFSFGMGFNLMALREFYEARLDAMEADPFKCEKLADLQAGVAKGREALNQPVPPMVYDIRGFMAVVDNIDGLDLASKTPPEKIDAGFVLAVNNAPALLQLGAMFSPEIAALGLEPDGSAVQFTPRQLDNQVENLWLALGESAVAFAVGDAAESQVSEMLKGASAEPAPFMSMSMDAARYYSLIGDAMVAKGGEEEDELPPEARESLRDMMMQFGTIYDRISINVELTSRGVELDSVVTLKD